AGPSASADPAAVTVMSPPELVAALGADRASWIGRLVVVDGRVALDAGRTCAADADWCTLGTLDGTGERVLATGYTNALLLPDTDFPTTGVMALVVRETGLEYLGYMGYPDGVSFEAPVASFMDMSQVPRGPMVLITSGWLVAGLPTPCPAQLPPAPQDTPFEPCPPAWLAGEDVQPVVVSGGSVTYVEPDPGFHVQYGAYGDFAADPAYGPVGIAEPKFGSYLVRLVSDTRVTEAEAPRGWQVVGRLSPSPAIGPSGKVGIVEPSPSAGTSPAPAYTLECGPLAADPASCARAAVVAVRLALGGSAAAPASVTIVEPGPAPSCMPSGPVGGCRVPDIIVWVKPAGDGLAVSVPLIRTEPSGWISPAQIR
ncbi:MAG: hypothetical protein WCK58_17910, partial [Chloroflexota bacterium]